MRLTIRLLTLAIAFAIAIATPGAARAGGPESGADAVSPPDSSRFLPRALHASLEAGVTSMRSPDVVSDRYVPGLVLGGSLTASAGMRARLAVRLEYFDLPNGAQGYYGTYEVSGGQATTEAAGGYDAFHGGHTSQGLGVLSVRAWGPLWLEAGAGYGYFWSGYPDIQFIDGATGEYIDIPGQSGWAPVVMAGLTYEFTPRKGQHLFASGRWTRLDRGDQALEFVPFAIGYRFD